MKMSKVMTPEEFEVLGDEWGSLAKRKNELRQLYPFFGVRQQSRQQSLDASDAIQLHKEQYAEYCRTSSRLKEVATRLNAVCGGRVSWMS